MRPLKAAIRSIIDDVKLADPRIRMFLDKSKDWSDYDVDDQRLPAVNAMITVKNNIVKVKKLGSRKRKIIKE
jgi:hypothetical protein